MDILDANYNGLLAHNEARTPQPYNSLLAHNEASELRMCLELLRA